MNRVVIEFERCKECGYCIAFCPRQVLAVAEKINRRGYAPAVPKQQEACTACGICARMCPDAAISVYQEEEGSHGRQGIHARQ